MTGNLLVKHSCGQNDDALQKPSQLWCRGCLLIPLVQFMGHTFREVRHLGTKTTIRLIVKFNLGLSLPQNMFLWRRVMSNEEAYINDVCTEGGKPKASDSESVWTLRFINVSKTCLQT